MNIFINRICIYISILLISRIFDFVQNFPRYVHYLWTIISIARYVPFSLFSTRSSSFPRKTIFFHRSKLQLPIAVEREDTSNALHRFFSIPLCSRLPYRSDRRKGSVKILKPLANAFTTLDKRRINMSYQYSSKSKTCALKSRKINFVHNDKWYIRNY